jgi:hypothetical protein
VIPAFGRLRQEDKQFEVSLGYVISPCLKKPKLNQVSVAHFCNPSQSGGRGQEDGVSKLAQANSS